MSRVEVAKPLRGFMQVGGFAPQMDPVIVFGATGEVAEVAVMGLDGIGCLRPPIAFVAFKLLPDCWFVGHDLSIAGLVGIVKSGFQAL